MKTKKKNGQLPTDLLTPLTESVWKTSTKAAEKGFTLNHLNTFSQCGYIKKKVNRCSVYIHGSTDITKYRNLFSNNSPLSMHRRNRTLNRRSWRRTSCIAVSTEQYDVRLEKWCDQGSKITAFIEILTRFERAFMSRVRWTLYQRSAIVRPSLYKTLKGAHISALPASDCRASLVTLSLVAKPPNMWYQRVAHQSPDWEGTFMEFNCRLPPFKAKRTRLVWMKLPVNHKKSGHVLSLESIFYKYTDECMLLNQPSD